MPWIIIRRLIVYQEDFNDEEEPHMESDTVIPKSVNSNPWAKDFFDDPNNLSLLEDLIQANSYNIFMNLIHRGVTLPNNFDETLLENNLIWTKKGKAVVIMLSTSDNMNQPPHDTLEQI